MQTVLIDPFQPQWRGLRQAAKVVLADGLIVYPTDACYALGGLMTAKSAIERICSLRQLRKNHDFTLLCRDLKEAAQFAHIDNRAFRLLKNYTPGPYTFILAANRHVPQTVRQFHKQKQQHKTVGIRIPHHAILNGLLQLIDQPLLTSTLQLADEPMPLNADDLNRHELNACVDLAIDGGPCLLETTTVIDLTSDSAMLVRQGIGNWDE